MSSSPSAVPLICLFYLTGERTPPEKAVFFCVGGMVPPVFDFFWFQGGEQIRREFNRSMKNDNCACHFLSGNRKNFPLIAHKLSVWVESVPLKLPKKRFQGGSL